MSPARLALLRFAALAALVSLAGCPGESGSGDAGAAADGSASDVRLALSDGPAFDFGPVVSGASAPHTFSLTNSGTAVAVGLTAAATGPFAFEGGFPGAGGTCAGTLAAGGVCTLVVTFSPTTVGKATGQLVASASGGGSAKVDLAGEGLGAPSLSISDSPSYDFGRIAVGGTAGHTFTVTNMGAAEAVDLSQAALAAPFVTGTGGTCTTSLAVGSSCLLVVNFAPAASGAATGSLSLSYGVATARRTVSVGLEGSAATPASLALSDGPTFDFGDRIDGSQTDHSFTATNSGEWDATSLTAAALEAPFGFKDGAFPGTGGTCSETLAAGASCSVVVTFAPTAPGAAAATLSLGYESGLGAQAATRDLVGSSHAPALLALSPARDFGARAVGTTTSHTFTVTNGGASAATGLADGAGLAAPFGWAGGSFPGTGGTCGASLAPAAQCTVVVAFAPTALGTFTASARVAYHDGVAAASASSAVQGVATDRAALQFADAPTADFGTRRPGQASERSLQATNTGAQALTFVTGAITGPFSFKGGSFPGTGGTCAAGLAAGASCTMVLVFAPTQLGAAAGQLSVAYSDAQGQQTVILGLAGTGAEVAALAISDGPTFDFGQVAIGGGVAEKTLTVSNASTVGATSLSAASLAAPFTFKGGTYPGTGGSCGSTLAGGASCSVVVRFAPTAVGPATAALDLSFHDSIATQSVRRDLRGTGATAAALVAVGPSSYGFGALPLGATRSWLLTVRNDGELPATGLAPNGPAAPFAFTGAGYPGAAGTCGATLASLATCTVEVAFSPTALGAYVTTAWLGYESGKGAASVAYGLSGNGVSPALLTISDAATYAFGGVATGAAPTHSFLVTNIGAVPAATVSATPLTAPFSFPGGFPGTGGTCGATIDPSTPCTVVVAFAPTARGAASANLTLGYDDGVASRTVSRAMTGTGLSPALLAFGAYDFGSVKAGTAVDHTFSVSNSGEAAATGLSFGALAGPFSIKTNGCGAALAGGGSCEVVVTFAPASAGFARTSLGADYHDGASARVRSVSLTGTGWTAAALAFYSAAYDFGAVGVGLHAERLLLLVNTGSLAATGVSFGALPTGFSYKGGAFPGSAGTCGAALPGGATCVLDVVFAPASAVPTDTPFAVTYANGDGATPTATTQIKGAGTLAASLAITDFQPEYYALYGVPPDGPTFEFLPIAPGAHLEHGFAVTNTGGQTAAITTGSVAITTGFAFLGGAYPGAGGTCGATLAAGKTCVVVVSFAPTEAKAYAGSLSIPYDAGTATRALGGQGVSTALLQIFDFNFGVNFGPAFDFGPAGVGTSSDHVFHLANSGGQRATSLSAAALTGAYAFTGGAYPGTGGTCGTSLAPMASCTLSVTFTPQGDGPATATLGLSYSNGAAGSQQVSRPMTGTGIRGALLRVLEGGPNVSFDQVAVGSTRERSVQLVNVGGATASSVAVEPLSLPFGAAAGGTCAGTLDPGASCTLRLTFSPTVAGEASSTAVVTYQDGLGTGASARVGLVGAGVSTALLLVTDWSGSDRVEDRPYDFGTWGRPTEHTFSVRNIGAQAAATLVPSIAAPFGFKGGSFPGTGGTCGTTSLAKDASCTVVVVFTPPASDGTHGGLLSIGYQDGAGAATATRSLVGTSTTGAYLTLATCPNCGADRDPIDLGVVGQATSRTLTVVNQGAKPATDLGAGLPALDNGFAFKNGGFPGEGGTCGTSLAPGATCELAIAFTPAGTGTRATTLNLSYADGNGHTLTASRDFVAVATEWAVLRISAWKDGGGGGDPGGPRYDFGTQGSDTQHTFYVANLGARAATSLAVGPLGTGFSLAGGPPPPDACGATLDPGRTCTLTVVFAPTGSTTFAGELKVVFHDGAKTTSSAMGLTARSTDQPQLQIRDCPECGDGPPTFDFGTTGQVVQHVFTVVNTGGGAAANLTVAPMANGFALAGGPLPPNACGSSLAKGASCTVTVVFTPSGAGTRTSTLQLDFDGGSASRPLTADAWDKALLQISEHWNCSSCAGSAPYDFGVAGVPVDRTFWVTNVGAQPAASLGNAPNLGDGFAFKGGAYPGSGGTCTLSLAQGATCSVVVTFSPPADDLQHAGTLVVGYHDGAAATAASRALVGTATTLARLELADCTDCGASLSYELGTTGQPTSHSFELRNVGRQLATSLTAAPLATGFSFKGGVPFPGSDGTCGTTLAAGARCTFSVTFTPSAVPVGQAQTALGLGYSDGAKPNSLAATVRATATNLALLKVSDWDSCPDCGSSNWEPYSFGVVGGTAEHTFYLTNAGAQKAASFVVGSLGAGFSFKGTQGFPGAGGTCGLELTAGTTCSVVVVFAPTGTGSYGGALSITYQDGAKPVTLRRDLAGTGTDKAILQIRGCEICGPMESLDLGVVGAPAERTLHLANVGGGIASTLTEAALGTGWSFKGGSGYPGSGGTCGRTLDKGLTCSFVVQFDPTGLVDGQTYATEASFSYGDGATTQVVARPLKATATTQAYLRLGDWSNCPQCSGPEPFDFGTAGIPVDHTFWLYNVGATGATGIGASTPALGSGFTFQGGSFPGTDGTCGSTLDKGQSCAIVVTFTPAPVPGLSTSSLNLTGSGGQPSLSRALRATTTSSAVLVLSECTTCGPTPSGPYEFGTWGIPTTRSLALKNWGGATATNLRLGAALPSGFAIEGGTFPGTTGTCTGPLTAGSTCTVAVTFAPPASDTSFAATLAVAGDGGSAPVPATRTLNARSTTRALLVLTEHDDPTRCTDACERYRFGDVPVDGTSPGTLKLFNVGRASTTALQPQAIPSPFGYAGGGAFPGLNGTCAPASPLAPGASCTLNLQFHPTSTGDFFTSLDVRYLDGLGAYLTASRQLEGHSH